MDIFSTQIFVAIRKIRAQKGRPDSDKIFKEIVKESPTNFTGGYSTSSTTYRYAMVS